MLSLTAHKIDTSDLPFEEIFSIVNSGRTGLHLDNFLLAVIPLQDLYHDFKILGRDISAIQATLEFDPSTLLYYNVSCINDDVRISIGGDCYREDTTSLVNAIDRTTTLASSMARKSVATFPDIPELTGGKKGEFGLVGSNGYSIIPLITSEGKRIYKVYDPFSCQWVLNPSLADDSQLWKDEEFLITLGSHIMSDAIGLLNDIKLREYNSQTDQPITSFKILGYAYPVTLSPDVLTGQNWAQICNLCLSSHIPNELLTCVPKNLMSYRVNNENLVSIPSAKPTGIGLAATYEAILNHGLNKSKDQCKILIEACGGVTFHFISYLLEHDLASPGNITVFDPYMDQLKWVRTNGRWLSRRQFLEERGIKAITSGSKFYQETLPNLSSFDIHVNNGLGEMVDLSDIRILLESGVFLFLGAANNIFVKEDVKDIYKLVGKQNRMIIPDEVISGGGYYLAVVDLLTRSYRNDLRNIPKIEDYTIQSIQRMNRNIVKEAIALLNENPALQLPDAFDLIIDTRLEKNLKRSVKSLHIGNILKDIDDFYL